MLFRLIQLYARLAIKIYCRRIVINKPHYLKANGPVLFAANHPNSFLDGIILTTLLNQPLYSLARGDAFHKQRYNKLLRWLHLLPVYRTSEGTENLEHNYTTFAACQQVFQKKGAVLIFSEAASVNEWHLRPLRKGTARLAISTWQSGMPLQVVPLGFNYSSFRVFGKNVHLNFGDPIIKEPVLQQPGEGKQLLAFNGALQTQLQQLVYEVDAADIKTLHSKLGVHIPFWKKALLALPAAFGWLVHAPLYYPVKFIATKFFDNDHFDSVVVALLMLAYPFYLLLVCALAFVFFNWLPALLLFFFLPFSAWACVQVKEQFGRKPL